MTHRVGPKGQVVLPKEMRDRLGIMPGDEVEFELDESGVRVLRAREKSSLRGSLSGFRLVDELLADRRAERDR